MSNPSKTEEILKIEQKAFVLLLIKRRAFLGYPVNEAYRTPLMNPSQPTLTSLTIPSVKLIPLLKDINSQDSYRCTMEQHFTSIAETLKNGINWTSDH